MDSCKRAVTNDMELGGVHYAALLTPQGKILFDFIVAERDGVFLIDCAKADAEEGHCRSG